MLGKRLKFITSTVVIVALVILPPSVVAADDGAGSEATIDVSSDPDGARIFIDGSPYGVTPITGLAIEPTEYTVTARCPGYAGAEGKIIVQPGDTARLDVHMGKEKSGFSIPWFIIGLGVGAGIGTGLFFAYFVTTD